MNDSTLFDFLNKADEGEIETISQESVAHLLFLQTKLSDIFARYSRYKAIVESALALRFSDKAKTALQADGRAAGKIRFLEEDCTITADFPKKVAWDQNKLSKLIQKIPEDERKQYIKVQYSIDERKYLNWPEKLKQFFEPARSTQLGKTKFIIQAQGEDRHD